MLSLGRSLRRYYFIRLICVCMLVGLFGLVIFLITNPLDFAFFQYDVLTYYNLIISNATIIMIFLLTLLIIDSKRIREETTKRNNMLILLWISYQKLAGMSEQNPSYEFLSLVDIKADGDGTDINSTIESLVGVCFPYHNELLSYGLNGTLEESHFANYLVFYNNFRELLYSITADSEPDLDKLDDITAFCNKEIESLAKEPIINNMLKKDQNMN